MKKDAGKSKAKKRAVPPRAGRPARVSERHDSDALLPEYPAELIRGGVRGKYAAHYAEGTNVVVLEPDVAAAFPDAASVNSALRALLWRSRGVRSLIGRLPDSAERCRLERDQ